MSKWIDRFCILVFFLGALSAETPERFYWIIILYLHYGIFIKETK